MLSRRDFGVGAIATATALGLTTVAVAQPAGRAALRMRRVGVMLLIPGNGEGAGWRACHIGRRYRRAMAHDAHGFAL